MESSGNFYFGNCDQSEHHQSSQLFHQRAAPLRSHNPFFVQSPQESFWTTHAQRSAYYNYDYDPKWQGLDEQSYTCYWGAPLEEDVGLPPDTKHMTETERWLAGSTSSSGTSSMLTESESGVDADADSEKNDMVPSSRPIIIKSSDDGSLVLAHL
jgi:hypothetical protein